MEQLTMWILDELNKRDWTPADLAKRAKIHQATLSNILNGNRKAGPEICLAVADALGERPERIFRLAGLLPPSAGEMSDLSEDEAELVRLYRQLSPGDDRNYALHFLRGYVDQMRD
jgi:transcriptional regulator with XRE-family HTH domain